MSLVVSVEPTEEPVTRTEVKAHLRIDTTDDNTLLDTLISAARHYAENFTRRAFVTQTLVLRMDAFPATDIELPRAPAASVTSIAYIDTDGATQTWAAENYTVDVNTKPARIVLAYDKSYPDTRTVINAVTVTYVAGYGDATTVPQGIKLAIKSLVGHWYENREGSTYHDKVHLVPLAIDALLTQYSIPEFV